MNSEINRIDVNGVPLEGKWFGAGSGPIIVMLHEGLGSVSTWRDFPQQLADATRMRVFAYSRASYGASPEVKLPRQVDYMHREALDVLPGVLDAIGFERGVLLGHSDGGSIATIYAGSRQDHRVRGLVLIEPHFFVEEVNLAAIRQTAENYKTTNLREKLARHHKNVDNAFEGWRSAWLNPKFKEFNIRDALAHIRVPILMIKGEHDPYSTLAQLEVAQADTYCPLEGVIIPGAGHSPQRDDPAMTLEVIRNFLDRLRVHEEARAAG
jgi:pimeloyl-ACP methyl ester carboxylesterase